MIKFIAPVLLIATLLGGCSEHDQDGGDQAAPPSTNQDSAGVSATNAVPPVSLNNGQRWKANPETTTGIANMAGILGAYDASTDDPKVLRDTLEAEFALIFERCTMTGEAHEQLHNYLLPIHRQLRDFETTEAQRTVLREHLAAYGTYFE